MISRPSRIELVRRLEAAITSRIGTEQMRESNAVAYSRSFAGVADAIYSLITYMHNQQFVITAEGEYLDKHGNFYGVDRTQATYAEGAVTFDMSAGGNVPSGTIVQTYDGIQFQTTENASAQGVAPVRALLPGAKGNLPALTPVNLVTPVMGVKNAAVITYGTFHGAEEESDEDYRQRILQRMRETPMGGADADYVRWALEIEDVTRAWCYPLENGLGTVVVRFAVDNNGIIPTPAKVAEVQAHINQLRPVTAAVTVVAPVVQPVNFVFSDITPDDPTVRAQVESELDSLFKREAQPGSGMYISHIRQAISNAAGETDYILASPSTNVVAQSSNHLLVLGSVTWQ